MIRIEITPATCKTAGRLKATGHAGGAPAGQNLLCCAVTTLEGALQANLKASRGIRVYGHARSGDVDLRWAKSDRAGKGLHRARLFAEFVYFALAELEKAHPKELRVIWTEPERKGEEMQ